MHKTQTLRLNGLLIATTLLRIYALFAKEREDSLDITEQILRSGALEPEDADFVYNFSSCTSEEEDATNTSQQFTWYSIFRNGIWSHWVSWVVLLQQLTLIFYPSHRKSRLCRIGILVTAYVTNKYFSNETSYPPCYISLWDAAAILILCGCISPRLMEIVALQRQKTKLKRYVKLNCFCFYKPDLTTKHQVFNVRFATS